MKPMHWNGLLAAILWCVVQVQACPAQYYPPVSGVPRPPSYSSYLNLMRPGNPAINYYGLVRPEIQARAAYQNLQQQVWDLQQPATGVTEPAPDVMPATGYPARFFDSARYFPGPPIGPGAGTSNTQRRVVGPSYSVPRPRGY